MTAREHISTANAYRVAERRNLQRAAVADEHGHAMSARGFRIAANVDAAAAREHTAAAAIIVRAEVEQGTAPNAHAPAPAAALARDPWTAGSANWRDGQRARAA